MAILPPQGSSLGYWERINQRKLKISYSQVLDKKYDPVLRGLATETLGQGRSGEDRLLAKSTCILYIV